MTRKRFDGAAWAAVAVPLALALAGPWFVAGCGSSGEKSKSSSKFAPPPDPTASAPVDAVQAPPKAWTDRFLAAGVLIADEIRIEGPAPLLDHVVTRPEAGLHDVQVLTIPAGFQQTISVRTPGAEIRAQIDQVAISALRRLVILERPGNVDVLVIAAGDVYWKAGPDAEPMRAQSLRIEGPIPR